MMAAAKVTGMVMGTGTAMETGMVMVMAMATGTAMGTPPSTAETIMTAG
jgi:hypothetical protein